MKFKEFINEAKFTGKIEDIKIEDIQPDQKDIDRISNLKATKEDSMAKSIKDPIKLVRRTKAYIMSNGNIDNPFTNMMLEMGFTAKQMVKMGTGKIVAPVKPLALPDPVKRNGKEYESVKKARKVKGRRGIFVERNFTIMNASSIYKGKLSKVIPDLSGDTVILLGLANDKRKVAIVGSASGMKINENGLDYYKVPKDGRLDYNIDTGNGYREPSSKIVLTDYVLTKNGKAVTNFNDTSYSYYVFK
jgi:hypothetical protein